MDEKLEKLSKEMDLLEEKCAVIAQRDQHLEQLMQLSEGVQGAKECIASCRKTIQEKFGPLKAEYQEVLKKAQYLQLAMLYLIQKTPDANVVAVIEPRSVQHKATPVSTAAAATASIPKPLIDDTPHRMHISEYGKSPFVSRKKPVKLEFLDFEAVITEKEFAKIPS